MLKGFANGSIAVDVSMLSRSAQLNRPLSGRDNGGIDLDWGKKNSYPLACTRLWGRSPDGTNEG